MLPQLFEISNYTFNWLAIPLGIGGLIVLFCGVYVLILNSKATTNIAYAIFTFIITIWILGSAISYCFLDPELYLYFYKHIAFSGVIFLPAGFVFFAAAYAQKAIKLIKPIVAFFVASFIFYLLATDTSLLIKSSVSYSWGNYVLYGWVGKFIYLPFFIILMVIGFYLLFSARTPADSADKKKQKITLIIFLALGWTALSDHLPALGIGIFPFGYLPVTIFMALLTHTIGHTDLFNVSAEIAADTIVSTIPDSLLIVNNKFNIQFANKTLLHTLKYTSKEILGKPLNKVLPGLAKKIKIPKKDQPVQNIDISFLAKNLVKIPVNIGLANINKDGENMGYVIVARDMREKNRLISDLKLRTNELLKLKNSLETKVAERTASLKEEKDKTAAIISNLVDPIIVLNRDNRIILANKSALKFFKIKPDHLGQRISENDNNLSMAAFNNIIPIKYKTKILKSATGGQVEIEEVEIHKRGKKQAEYNPFLRGHSNYREDSIIFKVITVPVLGEKNQQFGHMKIFYNLTRERLLDQAKSEFISVAAHQLRTPLSAIKWSLRLALDGDAGKLNKNQTEILNKGYASNERVINLVNDMLNVSRIEEGRFGYQFSLNSVSNIIKEATQDSEAEAKSKQIEIRVKVTPNLPDINVDKKKIVLAIQNILDNAIKYAPANSHVDISALKKKNMVIISVKDMGIGIPEKDQKKIASKFFRSGNVVRLETDGSGLGLFVVKNIIEGHGGELTFRSKEGYGSEFIVSLPVKFRNS